jgi:hypothetical protein
MSDDDPPAAGGAVATTDTPDGPTISLAPLAEPTHRAKPEKITV